MIAKRRLCAEPAEPISEVSARLHELLARGPQCGREVIARLAGQGLSAKQIRAARERLPNPGCRLGCHAKMMDHRELTTDEMLQDLLAAFPRLAVLPLAGLGCVGDPGILTCASGGHVIDGETMFRAASGICFDRVHGGFEAWLARRRWVAMPIDDEGAFELRPASAYYGPGRPMLPGFLEVLDAL